MSQEIAVVGEREQRRFLFLSSCPEAWGGSEELWSNAALRLARAGHCVEVYKTYVDYDHRRIKELLDTGIKIYDHNQPALPFPLTVRVARRLVPAVGRVYYRRIRWRPNAALDYLATKVAEFRPDLVVISQGDNFDGLEYVSACDRHQVPYVMISQKASDSKWPHDMQRQYMRRAYLESKGNYFVSQHNLELTEMQLGLRLWNAEVVRNPFLTPVDEPLPWPESENGELRLACVARMFVLEKGQDILLNVLAQEKWKARPVSVTFYGKGIHAEGLQQMAGLLKIKNVHFAGFVWNVTDIWRKHHGLVLPSRAEGLPLSLVEAMLCGRVGIVTAVGGNAEAVDDNETGFVASGASVAELDDAMERAWQRHTEWEDIGRLAARRIRERIPADPGEVFTSKLLQLCGSASSKG